MKWKNTKCVQLSYPVCKDTPAYGNSEKFEVKTLNSISSGATCNTSLWILHSHTGTHIDFPRHFSDNGATPELYPPEFWIFNEVALVQCSVPDDLIIKPDDISVIKKYPDCELLLIRTGYSQFRKDNKYWEYNPGLSPDIAPMLRNIAPKIRAVGMDFISVSSWQNRQLGRETHKVFLCPDEGKSILLIEDMNLTNLREKSQIMRAYIVPLVVQSADGAPCTAWAEVAE